MEVTKTKPEEETALYRGVFTLTKNHQKNLSGNNQYLQLKKDIVISGSSDPLGILFQSIRSPFPKSATSIRSALRGDQVCFYPLFPYKRHLQYGRVFVGFTAACVLGIPLGIVSGLEAPC